MSFKTLFVILICLLLSLLKFFFLPVIRSPEDFVTLFEKIFFAVAKKSPTLVEVFLLKKFLNFALDGKGNVHLVPAKFHFDG